MNISYLARTLMGEAQLNPKDSKALELRLGQLVRGVVLQVLDGNEALVAINGTQVRATIEMPLPTGKSMWLQVSEQAADGKLILKAAESGFMTGEQWINNMLRELGLKDTALHREIIRLAGEMQIVLQAKDAKAVSTFFATQGSSPHTQSIQSALLIVQRGLPLTAQTVDAVGQAIHGKPLPQLLQSLLAQLAPYTSAADDSKAGMRAMESHARQLVQQLSAAVRTWLAASGTAASLAQGVATGPSAQTSGDHTASTSSQTSMNDGQSSRVIVGRTPGQSSAQPATNTAGQGHVPSQPTSTTGTATFAPASASRAAANASSPSSVQQQSGEISRSGLSSMTEEALSGVRVASSSAAASSSSEAVSGRVFDQQTSPSNQQPQANKLIGSMLRQLLHLLGMDHEHQLLQRLILSRPAMASEGTSGEMSTSQGFQQLRSAEGTASANQQAPQLAADTVKSLLLKTVSNEQLPLPIREAAQQVAQAITGQQLLLAADRSAQMSYVTLFVPFMNEHGEQMAGVHIQTRKDKRGNLDSDNCHLFFDLQMKTLGNIMIDVQVVDRIVSLKIHHDHPQMQALIEEGRQSMMEALEAMGYRLSLIKAVPLPEQAHIVSSESAEQPVTETGLLKQMAQGMKYKGVDVRV